MLEHATFPALHDAQTQLLGQLHGFACRAHDLIEAGLHDQGVQLGSIMAVGSHAAQVKRPVGEAQPGLGQNIDHCLDARRLAGIAGQNRGYESPLCCGG